MDDNQKELAQLEEELAELKIKFEEILQKLETYQNQLTRNVSLELIEPNVEIIEG